ncbi:hypothetical protein J6590_057662 [Homalodisca vitripennis]|nr:hypothetical protein J6590_057662 [Homalodisca vitripennis]
MNRSPSVKEPSLDFTRDIFIKHIETFLGNTRLGPGHNDINTDRKEAPQLAAPPRPRTLTPILTIVQFWPQTTET